MNYSPLRYPGGKSSLYDFLKKSIEINNVVDGVYVECFAGGAGAALKLLMLEDVYEIILNDKDPFIYHFWKAMLENTEEFCKMISDAKITIDEWKYRKKIFLNKDLLSELSDLEIGFTAFFLNRCNRSGILHAGVIGGKHQEGDWKIDARFNKKDLIERIQKIALYKDRIKLHNMDALDFLKKIKRRGYDKKNLFVYLDPPYVEQGDGLYNQKYSKTDHIQLSKFLQRSYENQNWLVSYDDHDLIHKCYKEVEKNIFEFNYFANRTKVGRELVICSKHFEVPKLYTQYSRVKEPIKVKAMNELAV